MTLKGWAAVRYLVTYGCAAAGLGVIIGTILVLEGIV